MKKFYIITNKAKDADYSFTKEIEQYLQKNGSVCLSSNQEQTGGDTDYRYTDARQIPADTECIIVLGGDGTLIQAARDVNKTNIPLLGVNIGTLGYLTDADRSTVYEALNCCMQDTYEIDTRMMLSGTIYRDGEPVFENTALNDIVISRCGTLRVIDFDVHVNGEYLNSYSADGVIVSTATGSTAYSLSAGGPIIQPNAQMMMITPICPHTLNQRSIIFGAEDEIVIEMSDNKRLAEARIATFDGEISRKVITGDRIVVRRSEKVSQFIKTNKLSFLQRIRNKM